MLTAAEKMILNAVTAHRPDGDKIIRYPLPHQEIILRSGLASEEYRRFVGDRGLQVTWMFRILEDLSGGDVPSPRHCLRPDDVLTYVKDHVGAVFEDDLRDLNTDDELEGFRGIIENGKIVSPWNPETLKVVRWFQENITILGTWLIYQRVFDAVQDCVSSNLCSWSEGYDGNDPDPRKIARVTFYQAMQILYDDIKVL